MLNAHAAALIAREWGGQPGPDAITHLPRRTFLTQVTHQGELSQPFLIQTVSVPELYPDAYRPDHITVAQPLIDTASGRVDATKTITALDTLDARIQNHLTNLMAGSPTGGETTSQADAARSALPRLPDPQDPEA